MLLISRPTKAIKLLKKISNNKKSVIRVFKCELNIYKSIKRFKLLFFVRTHLKISVLVKSKIEFNI